MLEAFRARLRRRRGRFAALCVVALFSGAVAMAHSSAADHHMGEAAAMCLAIVVGGAAVATLPGLRDRPPARRPLLRLASPTPPQLALSAQHLARGDPALLQVFRR